MFTLINLFYRKSLQEYMSPITQSQSEHQQSPHQFTLFISAIIIIINLFKETLHPNLNVFPTSIKCFLSRYPMCLFKEMKQRKKKTKKYFTNLERLLRTPTLPRCRGLEWSVLELQCIAVM